jgi:hypothetical protein
MPVVINEFEAVPGEAPPNEGSSGKNEGDSAKAKEKHEPEKMQRLWQERQQRVRAH